MRTALVTFGGFTEDMGEATGTELLWRRLRWLASDEVVVAPPVTWDARVDRLAAFLRRQGVERVVVTGYSWGGGYGAQLFARECGGRGIAVPLMLLCDPVYRPLWLPPRLPLLQLRLPLLPLAFRAMLPGAAEIRIPRNVRRVVWVRQTLSLPMGHPLDADPHATVVEPVMVLPYGHTAIDAAPEWHELAVTRIGEYLARSADPTPHGHGQRRDQGDAAADHGPRLSAGS